MKNSRLRTFACVATILISGATALGEPKSATEKAAKAAGLSREVCSENFHERRAEARQAIVTQAAYMTEYNRAMPWFNAHCRFLSAEDIAIRKLDDPNSFVCESQKGRPPGLTTKYVLEHANPATISEFQDHSSDNMLCVPFDPISLYLADATPEDDAPKEVRLAATMRVLEVLCFESKTPKCDKARESIAAAKKKREADSR